jgi:hypothetical protein
MKTFFMHHNDNLDQQLWKSWEIEILPNIDKDNCRNFVGRTLRVAYRTKWNGMLHCDTSSTTGSKPTKRVCTKKHGDCF